jgi:hypothetical protein
MTPGTNFDAGAVDTDDKLFSGVNDNSDKLFTGVNDSAGKFFLRP